MDTKRNQERSMQPAVVRELLPKHLWMILAVYFIASLAHFTHNAEYIAFYPGMPAWLTRDKVYFAWLGVTSIGIAGLIVLRLGLHAIGALLLATYGALGLDGLAHYMLALCSEHTLMANVSIWAEAVTGFVLMLLSVLMCGRRLSQGLKAPLSRAG